jgi:hypothetical protein
MASVTSANIDNAAVLSSRRNAAPSRSLFRQSTGCIGRRT